jgi:hypothetical protein
MKLPSSLMFLKIAGTGGSLILTFSQKTRTYGSSIFFKEQEPSVITVQHLNFPLHVP